MNHRDQLTDELLSAYLDDELSGDELERVERALAEDPSYQQTLDDLKSLRVEMRVLPNYRLDDRFFERVLAASREPRRESESAAPRDGDAGELELGHPAFGAGRPLVYVVLALAAALLLMVAAPGRQGREERAADRAERARSPVAEQQGGSEDPGSLVAGNPAGEPAAGRQEEAVSKEAVSKEAVSKEAGLPERTASEPRGAEAVAGGTNRSQREPSEDPAAAGHRESPGTRQLAARSESGDAERVGPRARDPHQRGMVSGARTPAPATAADLTGSQPGNDGSHPRGPKNPFLQYLFVVNVDVTPQGTQKQVFLNALRGHGIRFESDLAVDDALERALLQSQMLAPVPADDQKGVVGELVYVVATGNQIDSTVRHLGASGLVSRLQFDVAIKDAQIDVFRKLRVADARDRETRKRVADQFGRARRLLWDLALLTPTARQVGAQSLLADGSHDIKGLLPRAKPNVGDEQAAWGANELFEVLFVVRRP